LKAHHRATPRRFIVTEKPSFFSRIINNDTARRGLAGAVVSVLVATVTELLWGAES